jgi:adenine deaminase
MFTQGGMTNMEALRAATANGAWYIGMDHELGSIEKGKLADLIVLDGNPLEDIRDSQSVRYTMVNGRLYDARTMDQVGNHPKKRLAFFWEKPGSSEAFVWHGPAIGYQLGGCGCFSH